MFPLAANISFRVDPFSEGRWYAGKQTGNHKRQACANSVDPDQMLQNVASDQGLQFATHPAILYSFIGCKMDFFIKKMWKENYQGCQVP